LICIDTSALMAIILDEPQAERRQEAIAFDGGPIVSAATLAEALIVAAGRGFQPEIDRAKDMPTRGGENIYCVEVENVLYDHPAVVRLKPGGVATESELRAFVRARLAAFKAPVKAAFWPETLPRNANGKILKTELKKVFATETETA
jgi:non-ribosomal peptide synthetase component E (peptide arylation enzyme)